MKKIDFLDLNNCNGGVGGMSLSNGTNHAHTNGNHHGSQGNLSRGIDNCLGAAWSVVKVH